MIDKVDHIMLVVDDVYAAMTTFQEKLGLTARYGGVHPRGTHNAIIHFPGKLGYFELFGPLDREQVRRNNSAVLDWIEKGGGIWRVAFGSDNVDEDHARIRANGIPAADIGDWNRKRPDGKTVYWRMFGVGITDPPRLYPFIIQWPPPAERIPDLEGAGFFDPPALPVTGIDRVLFVVPDLDRAAADFERVYGVSAGPETTFPDGRRRRIAFAENAVDLVQPAGDGPARDALDRLGPGAYKISLGTSDIEGARRYLEGNGVRVSPIALSDDGQRSFQIDPRDAHNVSLELIAER